MKENLYTPNSIRTRSGIYVDFTNLKPEMFTIEDIAHSLSLQCRFAGHLPYNYSVAQHSIMVSKLCNGENALAGLLHDASEAYLLDIPKPLKPLLEGYREIESTIMEMIAGKFGFQYPLPEQVKEKDKQALEFEWREIMLGNSWAYKESSSIVKDKFLLRFYFFASLEK